MSKFYFFLKEFFYGAAIGILLLLGLAGITFLFLSGPLLLQYLNGLNLISNEMFIIGIIIWIVGIFSGLFRMIIKFYEFERMVHK